MADVAYEVKEDGRFMGSLLRLSAPWNSGVLSTSILSIYDLQATADLR